MYIGLYDVGENISWWLMEVSTYVYMKLPSLFGDNDY